jgi:hypothetical protein
MSRAATASAPSARPAALQQFRVCLKVQRPNAPKAYWPRVGTAWENAGQEGQSPAIKLRFDGVVPLEPRWYLFLDDDKETREPRPRSEEKPKIVQQYRVALKVTRPGQEKPFWTRIGTAWENEFGGIVVQTDGVAPAGGDVYLFRDDERDREPGADDNDEA